MNKKRGTLKIGASACAIFLLCGCYFRALKSWPSRREMDQKKQGAVLLKLTADMKMDAFQFQGIRLIWRTGKDGKGNANLVNSLRIRPDMQNQFTNDVLLVPLEPGTYTETLVDVNFIGHVAQLAELTPEKPLTFTVEPGKVTVIGRLDLSLFLTVISQTEDSREFKTSALVRVDDSALAKTRILEEALARPEADSLQWRDALEAARVGLPPAR
jgi:hypothetical protein